MKTLSLLLTLLLFATSFNAQETNVTNQDLQSDLRSMRERIMHLENLLERQTDNVLLFHRLDDMADIDIVRFTSTPPAKVENKTAPGANNPVIVPAYTFIPKRFAGTPKLPLLVLVHGGVHSNFDTAYVHILRELLEQGYAVIAPDYRGSSGYGRNFYRLIDYGGRENDDALAARNWMVENNPRIDAARVGIMGWSHGGMISLMNIFEHPTQYKVAYAGVPVSDLVARMGYKSDSYRSIFSDKNHIGKAANEDIEEYRRRSPVFHAAKLQTPLLIHTNTSDEDVNVLEVEALINALKAANKTFDYKIYKDAPGGHHFNRINTTLARESRREIYRFLARHLSPPNIPNQ